jgi:death-on-curing protein
MKWPRLDAVLAMHGRQIAEHGGETGVRDVGLLESALACARNIASYEPEAEIARFAAAYAYGIARNHPFVDGNKRLSLVAPRTFIALNGYEFSATSGDKYLVFLGLAEGTLSEDELAEWLRKHIRKL